MEFTLTYSPKKISSERIIEGLKDRYDALNERVWRRKLRDSEIFEVAEVVFDNIERLEWERYYRTSKEIAEAASEVDRQLRILEAFVVRNELKKGYRPPKKGKTRRANVDEELIAVFTVLTERKVEPSPIFSRPIKRR